MMNQAAKPDAMSGLARRFLEDDHPEAHCSDGSPGSHPARLTMERPGPRSGWLSGGPYAEALLMSVSLSTDFGGGLSVPDSPVHESSGTTPCVEWRRLSRFQMISTAK